MSSCHVCCKTISGPEGYTFTCPRSHVFVTCGKCLGSFEELCKEVSTKIETAYKQHEERLCGNMDKRRAERLLEKAHLKLPSGAREQKKQFERAASSGALLCPADQDDRSLLVPLCAQMLSSSQSSAICATGEEEEEGNGQGESAALDSPLPLSEEAPLRDYDELILINSPEGAAGDADDALARGTPKAKKKQNKPKKERARMYLFSPFYQELDDSGAEEMGSPVAALQNSPVTIAGSPTRGSWAPPQPLQKDIAELSDMLSISESQARKLMKAAGGSPEAAVTAFFAKQAATGNNEPDADASVSSGTTTTAVTPPESFASVASLTAGAGAQRRDISTSSTAKAPSVDLCGRSGNDPPPPGRPPPPLLPQGWKAQWCSDANNYYYWNVETHATQWDVPGENPAAAGRSSKTPPPKALPAAAMKAHATSASPVALPHISQALVEEMANITGCSWQESVKYLDTHAGNLEAAVRAAGTIRRTSKGESSADSNQAERDGSASAANASCARKPPSADSREYLCTQNWQPSKNVADAAVCLSLVHGERMRVTWTDGDECGWAYVEIVSSDVKGYCPQAILLPAPPAPKPLGVGERFRVRVSFREPGHVRGYVPVEPGDEVIVEHPVEEPVVWAYVTRTASRYLPAQCGWLPVCVLCDSMGCGPARAG